MRRAGVGLWRRGLFLLAFLSAWAGAAELPLWLGPARPAVVAGWPPAAAGACATPADRLERALWEAVRTPDGSDLSCGNAFLEFLRTPRDLNTPVDAFDRIAQQVVAARSEVLLASMEWWGGPGMPGWTFARAVRDLYARVRAAPGEYPQGVVVRALLGGYPDPLDPDGTGPALVLARDLRALGVPLEDPALGWQVSVLTFRFLPHSHVKLHVIDGTDLTVAGFNFSAWHLPAGGPVPGARSLHDLGLRVRGPAAQAGVAAFDDLWRHSWQLRCPPLVAPDAVSAACVRGEADPVSHPPAAREAVRAGEARAFLLYRRPGGEDQADRAQLALIGAARESLDLMQADFGTSVTCWFAFLRPDPCRAEDQPPYFGAVLAALERGVRVRLLLVDYGVGAPTNRSAVALLRRELRRRGLEDRFEARYTTFALHTKALVVDRSVVVAGSINFHFSAWGPWGLAEAALATSDGAAVAAQDASFAEAWRTSSRPVPREWWLERIPVGAP
ncbi:phospholipase [Deinococcus indicus]|uniref:phospholipase D n=1 Tax=Deinococcus indicus TaxID=223556 RepID=A0A246BPV0_9DEIO|nr:phospholipase D-like domain-containing protein [Deinococcus indicus]OWL97674.1 phospholipase [Deinococcus indicus]GHG17186.1 phospholipase [Deinococcus indicus]